MSWKIREVLVVSALVGFGCGDSEGGSDGGGASSGGGELSCCINDKGYDCPNEAAFDKCAGFDQAACDAACAPADGACHADCAMQAANATHDPSDCDPNPNASACNLSGSTGTGSCTPQAIGCETSIECCDGLTCQTDPMSGTSGKFCL
jgi:hypothetical protein